MPQCYSCKPGLQPGCCGPLAITDVKPFLGPCGSPVADQSNAYLDRVGSTCPADHPVMTGIRFVRCGTNANGMQFELKCGKIGTV
eukprot:NODE_3141_length_379_cov_351.263636_g3059_i0.p2 GENE.NODE_3141_length_379_cov_351.263636_g3059_i0~~NODE_3141_length_379_cov_351.263636_g3059_i0.p2  ORF type:complete len:85 (+),score=7.58 NODE_3141_length_379_cov_351.263636_g3059_i0:39-293(+)